MTPGYKTTEFWLTLTTQLIGLFVLLGFIIPSQSPQLLQNVSTIIGSIATIIPAVVYILGRTWLKSKVTIIHDTPAIQ